MSRVFSLSSLGTVAAGGRKPVSLLEPGGYEPDIFTALLLKLDENEGEIANDSSENGNIGLITGAQWCAGRYGSGLRLDGINDYVEVPDSPSLRPTDAVTLEAYIDPEETPRGFGTIICKNGSYFLGTIHFLSIRIWGGVWRGGNLVSISSDGTLKAGDFQHVALTFDGSVLKLFIGGQIDKEDEISPGPLDANTNDVLVGAHRRGSGETRLLPGRLDEVRISSVARNPQEFDPNT